MPNIPIVGEGFYYIVTKSCLHMDLIKTEEIGKRYQNGFANYGDTAIAFAELGYDGKEQLKLMEKWSPANKPDQSTNTSDNNG